MNKLQLIILLFFTFKFCCFCQDTEDYQSLLNEIVGDNEYSFAAKAMIYQNLSKSDSALFFYNKAINLRENHSEANNDNKIVLTFDASLYAEFEDIFETGMIYYYTAVVCHDLMKLDSAIINYKKNISINPKFGDAYYHLALVYMDLEQYNLAVKELSNALKVNPQDKLYLFNRAYCYRELGNDNNALIDIEKSLVIDPNEPYSYKMLGDIYLTSGDTVKACIEWDKAQKLDLEIEEYIKCKCQKEKN
jgi:tetratricopeptide (TPR) repeat protein